MSDRMSRLAMECLSFLKTRTFGLKPHVKKIQIYIIANESINKIVKLWLARHLGDLRTSYNQRLTFFLKFTQSKSSMSRQDLILSNSQANLQIWRSFYDQYSSAQPDYFGQFEQEFSFLLSERDQWRPTLSARDFQRLLSNLTSIRIKSSLGGYTFLKAFKMSTAKPIKGGLIYLSLSLSLYISILIINNLKK